MNTELRPTPECDAAIDDSPYYQSRFVMVAADFARKLERERDEARDLAARLERENENLRNALHLAESAYRDAIASSDKFESLYNDLRWLPLSRLTPTEDDGNEYHDVEWSDGKEVWQNQFTNPNIGNRKATHWRRITLP